MTTEPQRKLIVAIHGAGMCDRVWGSLADIMTDHPLQAISLPGHGNDVSAFLDSIEKMGEWMVMRLKDQPAKSVILIGHSMGALVALEAAKSPAVAGLVFIGAAPEMPVNNDLLREAKSNPTAAADMIMRWSVSKNHPWADTLTSWLKKEITPSSLYNDLTACNNYRHGRVATSAVRVPAIVVVGAEDKMVKPAAAEEWASLLPGKNFHKIADAGHMPMVEQPAETLSAISGFIGTLTV